MKYGGPSGGSPLSGGGIIILCVIRRHFLTAAVAAAHADVEARNQEIYEQSGRFERDCLER